MGFPDRRILAVPVKRAAAIVAALLLVALPATAQTPEQPPAGTVLVIVGVSDGLTWVPLSDSIVVPPIACDPA